MFLASTTYDKQLTKKMGLSHEVWSHRGSMFKKPTGDRIEELIVELLLMEYVCCQKQSWSFMHLLCSGMVGFGLRGN